MIDIFEISEGLKKVVKETDKIEIEKSERYELPVFHFDDIPDERLMVIPRWQYEALLKEMK